jgi:hypothetical protein
MAGVVLLEQTKRLAQIEEALLGIVSAITQTPGKNVQKARLASSIATAKLTGAATTASIWGLVSTLGTAGTGTAIGTLSGAASTSATLAWIGGLVGGGMAAGAVILPITGIAAGAAATFYIRHKLYGRPRKLQELLYFEEEILFAADSLLRPLDKVSHSDATQPTADELRVYAHDGLKPLIARIEKRLATGVPHANKNEELSGFGATLIPMYQKQLRRHYRTLQKHADFLLVPYKRSAMERIGIFIGRLFKRKSSKLSSPKQVKHLSSVVLAVTFQRLLDDKISMLSLENDLVLDALRRSTGRLNDASITQLSEYVRGLTPEQLAGVVSNTKGIYHEFLFIEMHNLTGSALSARVMENTNFAGVDVQFILDDEIVREVQLKAVSSPTLIYEHLERYPDIEILVTEETAAILDGIDSSGLSNAVLTREVAERMSQLQGEGFIEEVSDGILTSVFVTSGYAIWNVLKRQEGQTFDFKPYLNNAGIAVGAASVIEGAVVLAGG